MRNLAWYDLIQPAYVLTFIRGFLLAAIPTGTLTHTTQNGAAAATHAPGILAILFGVSLGVIAGIDNVRTLATPPPTMNNGK